LLPPQRGSEQMANGQSNLILANLSSADFALLEPHLEAADLPARKVLETRGRRISTIYFPEAGFASVVANDGRLPIEVGLIGREGMSGLSAILGGERTTNDIYMQSAGNGHCVRAKALRGAVDESRTLHWSLLRFVNAFLNQVTRSAVANGRNKIEERLARWILMADDRLDVDELPLTQEFLAIMLGVQRPGITVALQALESRGVVARRRGKIVIADRRALEELSNGAYSKIEKS
jgi:CRP-like cAMP-binding protein